MVDTIALIAEVLFEDGRYQGEADIMDASRRIAARVAALEASPGERCECGATAGRDCEQGDARVMCGRLGLCWPEQSDPAPSVATITREQVAQMAALVADHARIVAELREDYATALTAGEQAMEREATAEARADALAGVLRRWQAWNDFHSDDRELERDTRALLSEAGK